MRIPDLLSNLEFVGRAEGDRRTYYVFKGRTQYVVASANREGLNVNVVDGQAPAAVLRRFAGKRVTSKLLGKNARSPGMFGKSFQRLNSLYVMVALGKAAKLKERDGKAMVFKIAAH
ncbi:MAG TPA: hypothetical protein VFR84_18815 [Candidatus Angelobacter sp.]|nr:hypothetical protein [Candidatus Angelobacter sp.]